MQLAPRRVRQNKVAMFASKLSHLVVLLRLRSIAQALEHVTDAVEVVAMPHHSRPPAAERLPQPVSRQGTVGPRIVGNAQALHPVDHCRLEKDAR